MFQNKIIFLLLLLSLTMFGNCSEEKKDNTALLAALALLGGGTGAAASSNTGATITRNWGTFTDMLDGTVRLVVTAGTFGGQTYTAQTLFYAKCSHGQTYDAGGNTCTGTATTVQFCTAFDNSCNGNDANLPVSSGPLFNACNGLSLANKTWRVPSKNELKLLIECTTTTTMPTDGTTCGGSPSPAINTLFPNTVSQRYWSSTTAPITSFALYVSFSDGNMTDSLKTNNNYVRCVSGTP